MRVLVVGPDRDDPGGVANYYNAVFPRLCSLSVEAHYLEIGSTKSGGGLFNALSDQCHYWRTLGQFDPEIVHLNPSLDFKSFIRDGMFILLGKLRSRKILVFFRGWQKPFEARIQGLLRFFFSITYQRADGFIVLAKEFANALEGWGVTAPIALGTTTVDDKLLAGFSIQSSAEDISRTETIRLLYLARLERDKGVLELADAVETLVNSGLNVSLTIAGTGPATDELRSRVESMGKNQAAISLVGYVRGENKAAVFRSHHIFCFPTQYGEGMPNAVLEAMAFGLPVLTCPVGGIADFFEDGKMGSLVNNPSSRSIANSISGLIKNRAELRAMANYNYTYAQRHFLASTVAKFLRDRYADMSAAS